MKIEEWIDDEGVELWMGDVCGWNRCEVCGVRYEERM